MTSDYVNTEPDPPEQMHREQTPKPPRYRNLAARLLQLWTRVAPGQRAWQGAALGIAVAATLMLVWTGWSFFGAAGPLYLAAGLMLFLLLALLTAGLAALLLALLTRLPRPYRLLLPAAIVLLTIAFVDVPIRGIVLLVGGMLLFASLAGAALWVLIGTRKRPSLGTLLALIIGLGGLAVGLYWLLGAGRLTLIASVPVASTRPALITDLPDPALPGPYPVQTLSYGSGTDRRRPEYGDKADLITRAVDGTSFVSGWSRLRTHYWGFDRAEMPLNGRVWYPDGAGPFPLVLMVHGNHNMADFSDPGYAYLGELLAGRGFIAVSVDQNFLNGSAVGDMLGRQRLRNENDARGWLLLQHLAQWQRWHEGEETPFAGLVDMEQIGLIGHSRGGEAVAVAALFNRLSRYPDNAKVVLDFNYGIRAVAAIAPVDGQYRPGNRPTPLENLSYLVLHGSHDMDVSSYAGQDQFARVSFTDNVQDWFKAGVYVYRANHGQFNSTWGAFDLSPPRGFLTDRGELLTPDEQQHIATVYLSAFMETMLQEGKDYRALFRDPAIGAAWLPETVYLAQYSDPAHQYLATFEEDLETSTGTAPGTRLLATALTTWRERAMRSKTGSRQNHAVYLGWDHDKTTRTPTYTLNLSDEPVTLTLGERLIFSVADNREADDALQPLDFTVEMRDSGGRVASAALSQIAPLSPPLPAPIMKLPLFTDLATSEPVLSYYEFPLEAFAGEAGFDPTSLAAIRFLFDRSPAGEIILDDIGIRGAQP